MATISGEVVSMNQLDSMIHAVGSVVVIRHNRKTIATAEVAENNEFSAEIDDDIRGEVEVSLGLHSSAPSLIVADGTDFHITVFHNNSNNFLA